MAATDDANRSLGFPAAALLVVLTSAAVLLLEVLVVRLVAPYVGLSLDTYTAAIGVALAAISLGAALGGSLADAWDPRRWIGPVIVLAGALVLAARPIVLELGPHLHGGAVGTVLLVAAGVALPVLALSTVSPAVVRMRMSSLSETGRTVGRLSSLGTLGALAGTFLTGFVLLGLLSTSRILLVTGTALVLTGLGFALFQRGRIVLVPVLLAVVTGGWAATSAQTCDYETRYYCVEIRANGVTGTQQFLILNGDYHSYVDTADLRALGFTYTQRIGRVLDAKPQGSLDVLQIGGGGFSLPRYVETTRPGSRVTVLELDKEIPRIARARLGLDSPDMRIVLGDARRSIGAETAGRYDVVIGDAFDRLAVPWHLTTREMVESVRRVLAPDGIYALNVIDSERRRFVHAEAATLRAVFAHVALLACPAQVSGTRGGNFVLVASMAPMPSYESPAEARCYVDEGGTARFAAGARVLTDNDAPVEQLMSRHAYTR